MNAEGGEKWVDALKKWDDGGRKGRVPGLGKGKVGGEGGRDYTGDAGYYLRPEVSLFPCAYTFNQVWLIGCGRL
jgi:mannosyl-oligosaccharide alpha-1,2-mannosidase